MDTFTNIDNKNSLYIAIDMNRLSLNSDGAFRTTIHKRIPHAKNNASTENKRAILSTYIKMLFSYNVQ